MLNSFKLSLSIFNIFYKFECFVIYLKLWSGRVLCYLNHTYLCVRERMCVHVFLSPGAPSISNRLQKRWQTKQHDAKHDGSRLKTTNDKVFWWWNSILTPLWCLYVFERSTKWQKTWSQMLMLIWRCHAANTFFMSISWNFYWSNRFERNQTATGI